MHSIGKYNKNALEKHSAEHNGRFTGYSDPYRPETGKDSHKQKTGSKLISELVRHLSDSPGVYRMLDRSGDVLYIGKAKNLKKRVSSYTKADGHTKRITRMIHETHRMEFITTHTETEALLLEANLIKRLRPRFNVLLRDDKSLPYIVITNEHGSPGIYRHRGARRKGRQYFGPFASSNAVTETINAIQKAFLIRNCTDSVFEGRTRPCLLYQIRRCSAPCTGEISEKNYNILILQSKQFLSGKDGMIRSRLSEQMNAASESRDFERAALYRDRLAALSHIRSRQSVNPGKTGEADVFAIAQKGGMNCVQVFFFRAGQNWGNQSYFPRADKSLEVEDVLKSFLTQFYDNKPCPGLVLLSHKIDELELISVALSNRAERKVRLAVPARGEKRQLVNHALVNAEDALDRKLAETATQEKLLAGVARTFRLDTIPQRIEVYDNSHIMGSNAVGAMVVSGRQGFIKNQYRKFNMKSKKLTPGDDYGMMREMITRRFSGLLKEYVGKSGNGNSHDKNRESENDISLWPDLLLIDGGLGQLNSVLEILTELGIAGTVSVVAIAKGPDRNAGREKFFIPGRPSFMLPLRDPVLYFVQRLRDEAHRFAIGSHRARRRKEITKNPLDEIGGIGPFRKRALLNHFGTAKAIGRAALADLEAVEGISVQMAQAIYSYFNENQKQDWNY